METEETREADLPGQASDIPVEEIVRAVKSLRYGSVQIIVQDFKVVQIDKTEKNRLVR